MTAKLTEAQRRFLRRFIPRGRTVISLCTALSPMSPAMGNEARPGGLLPAPCRWLARRARRQLVGDQNSRLARRLNESGAGVRGRRPVLPCLQAGNAGSGVRFRVEESRRPLLQQPLGRTLDVADRSANAVALPDVHRFEVVKHADGYRKARDHG